MTNTLDIKLELKTITLLKILLFLSFFQYTFKDCILTSSLNIIFSQLDDLFLIIMLTILIGSLLIRSNNFTFRKTPIDFFFIGIVYVTIISFLFNNSLLYNLLLTFKNYLLVFVGFYFIMYLNRLNLYSINKIISFIIILFSIQLPFQVFQIVSAFMNGTLNDDSAMGTFSGANTLGYTLFIPIFFVTYMYLSGKKEYGKYVIVLFITLIATFAEFTFLMFPLLFGLYNIRKIFSRNNLKKILTVVVIFIILFTLFGLVNPQRTSNKSSIFRIFSPSYLVEKFTVREFDVRSGSARLLWYPVTYEKIDEFAYNPSIGIGPGMYASYAAFKTMPEPNKSIYNIFGQLELGLDTGIDSQFIPLWGEFGYLGLILFVIMYLYLNVYFYLLYKKSDLVLVKALNITASASSLYLIFGMYVNHILENQNIMMVYVVFIALAYKSYQLEKKRIQ